MAFFTQKKVKALLFTAAFLLLANALHQLSWRLMHFGVILPLILGVAAALLGWKLEPVRAWARRSRWRGLLWQGGWMLFAVWLVSLCVFFVMLHRHAERGDRQVLSEPPEAVLILGSGPPDCTPSPSLQSRLDRGLEIIVQTAEAARPPVVVVSGGRIRFRDCTEAQVMAAYLTGRLPAGDPRLAQLLTENESTSTEENLLFTQPLLLAHGIDWKTARIAIVSNHFHLIRAAAIARRQGCGNCYTVGAPAPAHTRLNIWLREYFAFISGWVLSEY